MSQFNPNEHLMDLKGKKYLQVMWRLVWFREDHPNWGIDTQLVSHDPEKFVAVFAAKITDENGKQVSSGFGSESAKDFRDYLEKAETKAVGRALAMLGYGTQFAPEMDEGERIVDSPVQPTQKPSLPACANVKFIEGKYQGKTIAEVWKADIGFIKDYLENGSDSWLVKNIEDFRKYLKENRNG